jgi:hypothetical protein
MGDMIGFAGDSTDRQFHIGQRDRVAKDGEPFGGKAVRLAQSAQVFDGHLGGQVRAIAIPDLNFQRLFRKHLQELVAAYAGLPVGHRS